MEYAKKVLAENWPEWSVEEKLGEGTFGKVYKIKREFFGREQYAALKLIRVSSKEDATNITYSIDDKSFVSEIVSEIELMAKLKGHTNIVSYEDHKVIEDADSESWTILIRMELLTPLRSIIGDGLSKEESIKLGIDICKALGIMHKHNIIHRDVKSENIFVSENGDYKLGDFGTARIIERTEDNRTKTGTFLYMAPEVIKSEPYGAKADIYSLGILLYTLLNDGRFPFFPPYPENVKFEDRQNAFKCRISGQALPEPRNADKAAAAIILKACEYDSKKRFSSVEEMGTALESLTSAQQKTVKIPSGSKKIKAAIIAACACVAAIAVICTAVTLAGKDKIPVNSNLSESGIEPELIKASQLNAEFGYDIYTTGIEITSFLGADAKTIEIPEKIGGKPVFSIGSEVFANSPCEEVSLPSGLKKIGSFAFINCKNLRTVNLPEGLESIGEKAFADCIALNNLNLPSSIKEIGSEAFSGCDNLCKITMPATDITFGIGVFNGTPYAVNRRKTLEWHLDALENAKSRNATYALHDLNGDGCPELIINDEGDVMGNILRDEKTFYSFHSFENSISNINETPSGYYISLCSDYAYNDYDSLCDAGEGNGIYGYILREGYEEIYHIDYNEEGIIEETVYKESSYAGSNAKLPGKEIVFLAKVSNTEPLEEELLRGIDN
ncbi:MAG: protein kinase [Clostridia bacterium]|nr:protein kinase [Clostridia bacterium]